MDFQGEDAKTCTHRCAASEGDCVYVQMLGSMEALGQQGKMLWLAQQVPSLPAQHPQKQLGQLTLLENQARR